MSNKSLSTTREALMAELLIDVDRLLDKVSNLDQSLADTIEKSTKEAANKGYLSASLQMKRLAEEIELKIETASTQLRHFEIPASPTVNALDQVRGAESHYRLAFICFLATLLGSASGTCLVLIMKPLGL